jgi:hypothetical protein
MADLPSLSRVKISCSPWDPGRGLGFVPAVVNLPSVFDPWNDEEVAKAEEDAKAQWDRLGYTPEDQEDE